MQRDRDLRSLSNAYLKALITEHGYSHDGLLTREELVARAEEAAATPHLPPLEADADGIDSEEEQTEEAEALAQRLLLQELRAIVAVRDAAACSVGDVLKLDRPAANRSNSHKGEAHSTAPSSTAGIGDANLLY
jgi:hypothetical protein